MENERNKISRVLIVDDDESIRNQMKWALSEKYEILLAEDRKGATQKVNEYTPEIVFLDLGLPPNPTEVEEGFRTLGEIIKIQPRTKIIVVTGQRDDSNAMKAIEKGAYDFFSKPIEIETLNVVLDRAIYLQKIEEENRNLRAVISTDSFQGMIGTSNGMQKVFATLKKVARTEVPVLIAGESGTGKELAAKAIHELSPRKTKAFVPINCGAIPENLLESELFGHEKGSFTGAHSKRTGQIDMAEGGTLFLDEIGELPLQLQVKLLRFLQDGNIQRVGGRKQIHIDTRIIAATNAELDNLIQNKLFREDLYYRLAVIVIDLPPLRERDEDILLLANYFLRKFSTEIGRKSIRFSADARETILNYSWPGNIREMENRVRRAVIMAEGSMIEKDALGLDSSFTRFEGLSLRSAREKVEKEMITRALTKNGWNISRASVELDVSRPTLYELMEKLEISRP